MWVRAAKATQLLVQGAMPLSWHSPTRAEGAACCSQKLARPAPSGVAGRRQRLNLYRNVPPLLQPLPA